MPDIKSGSFETKGMADLEKRLLEFSDRIAKNVVSGGVRAGAVVIQKEARLKVPVSKQKHILRSRATKGMKAKGQKYMGVWITPGNLKRNIKVRQAPYKKRTYAIEYWIYVGGKYSWYWRFVELGSSKMAAEPFLRPAFEGNKTQAVDAMREYMGPRIEKEAAKR